MSQSNNVKYMAGKGRPNEFKKEYIKAVDDYLKECSDKYIGIVEKSGEDGEKIQYLHKDARLKVKLPTIEGFALRLGVCKKSIYNWAKDNEKFLHALEKIEIEQKERLINMGLSGEYNSTIAKLILSANHGMAERNNVNLDDEKPYSLDSELKKELDNILTENTDANVSESENN